MCQLLLLWSASLSLSVSLAVVISYFYANVFFMMHIFAHVHYVSLCLLTCRFTHIYTGFKYIYIYWSFISICFNHTDFIFTHMYRYTRWHVFVIFMWQHITAVRALQFLISGARTTLPRKALLELLNLELEICGFVDWKQHLEKKHPFSGHQNLHSEIIGVAMLLHFFRKIPLRADTYKSAGRMSSASQVPFRVGGSVFGASPIFTGGYQITGFNHESKKQSLVWWFPGKLAWKSAKLTNFKNMIVLYNNKLFLSCLQPTTKNVWIFFPWFFHFFAATNGFGD